MKIDKESVIIGVLCVAILVGFVSWVLVSSNQEGTVTTEPPPNTNTTEQIDHMRWGR